MDDSGASLTPGPPNIPNVSLATESSTASKRSTRNIFRRSRLPSEFGSNPDQSAQSGREETAGGPSTRIQSTDPPLRDPFADPPAEQRTNAHTPDAPDVHMKTPGGGSVRSILRDPLAPSTGQSVRFNQRDAFRIITPNASASSAEGQEEGSPRTFLQRLRDAGSLTDDEDERRSNPGTFPLLLERDPFAATSRLPLSQKSLPSPSPMPQDISNSFSSTSSKDLPSLPSDMDNLFDVSNDLNAVPLFDSLVDVESKPMDAPIPPIPLPLPSVEGPGDPPSVDVSQTPRRIIPKESAAVEDTSPNSEGAPSLFYTPTHSRMPSEAPTIRPSPTSQESPASSKPSLSQPPSSSSRSRGSSHTSTSPSLESPEAINATVYHTPRTDSIADDVKQSPVSFTNYVRPSVPRKLVDGEDTGVPAFLIPSPSFTRASFQEEFVGVDDSPLKRHADERDLSVTNNTAFLVPNNSVAFPFPTSDLSSGTQQMLSTLSQDNLINHLKERLSLLESISVQYEVDLSARDTLVDQLSTRINQADEELHAWRTEADRTTRKFDRLRQKVNVLTTQCEALNKEKAALHAEKRRSNMFDMASSVALRELHQRVGNLEAGKSALEERLAETSSACVAERNHVQQLELEKAELTATLAESERECARWRQAVEAYEVESTSAADLLNSFLPTTPAKSRPGFNKSAPGTPRSAFSRPISMFSLNGHLPENEEQVYVLKSEIIRREQEYTELRELHRTTSFKATEEKLLLTAEHEALAAEHELLQVEHEKLKLELGAQNAGQDAREALEKLEKDYAILKAELDAQWALAEESSDKLSRLEGACTAAEEEARELRELHSLATEELRKAVVKEEKLKTQIEQISHQCDDLTYSRDDESQAHRTLFSPTESIEPPGP